MDVVFAARLCDWNVLSFPLYSDAGKKGQFDTSLGWKLSATNLVKPPFCASIFTLQMENDIYHVLHPHREIGLWLPLNFQELHTFPVNSALHDFHRLSLNWNVHTVLFIIRSMCVCQAHIVHTLVCVSLVSLTAPEDEILTQIKVFLQMFFWKWKASSRCFKPHEITELHTHSMPASSPRLPCLSL